MLNVAQITSDLARLPDNALQRYAMMHKDDPYVLSLAMSESNRRKEMRSGAHMQAPKQPTVVDQAVAQMAPLPEQVGIGALPAPNMQQMADGGIAGYADGNLIAQNEPVVRMSGGGVVAFNGENDSLVQDKEVQTILQKSPYERTPADNAMLEKAGYKLQRQVVPEGSGVARANEYLQNLGPRLRDLFTGGASSLSDEELAARPNAGGVMNERILRGLGIAPSTPSTATASTSGRLFSLPEANPSDFGAGATPTAAAPLPAPVVKPPVMRPPVATPPAAPAPTSGLSALAAAQKMPDIDPVAQAQAMGKAIYGAQEKPLSIEERIARRDRFLGESPLKAQLERLAKQDDAAKKEKSDAASMALIKAGLSMMNPPRTAGGKFAGLLAGVGKGAGEGLEDYQVAMKELKAADREREKMRMDIERGQYAEKAGKWDNAEAAYEKAADRQTKMKDHIMQAASTGYGELIRGQLNLQQAQLTGEYGLKREEMQGINALKAAQVSAAAHDPLALYRVLGNGNISAGYAIAKQDPLRAQMTEQWSKQAYPAAGMPNEAFLKRYPTPETYVQEALTMQQSPGAAPTGGGKEPLIRSR